MRPRPRTRRRTATRPRPATPSTSRRSRPRAARTRARSNQPAPSGSPDKPSGSPDKPSRPKSPDELDATGPLDLPSADSPESSDGDGGIPAAVVSDTVELPENASPETLPFTGIQLGLLALIGLTSLVGGFALRRSAIADDGPRERYNDALRGSTGPAERVEPGRSSGASLCGWYGTRGEAPGG